MMQVDQTAVWERHSQHWSHVGPPLKPSAQDAEFILQALGPCLTERPDPCRVVILGVTPELVGLPWPGQVHLLAFDHSARMIAEVWSPNPAVPSFVQEADWRRLPLDTLSIHAVVGDGSLNVLPDFDAYLHVLGELYRVMAPEARLVLRCFIRPDHAESLSTIKDAVVAGEVGNFHALKWRIAMSLASVTAGAVAVTDIHDTFQELFPDRVRLCRLTGWSAPQVNTIEAYRSALTRYTFPTLQEMKRLTAPYFDLQLACFGDYVLAERCPTLTLIRKSNVGANQ